MFCYWDSNLYSSGFSWSVLVRVLEQQLGYLAHSRLELMLRQASSPFSPDYFILRGLVSADASSVDLFGIQRDLFVNKSLLKVGSRVLLIFVLPTKELSGLSLLALFSRQCLLSFLTFFLDFLRTA